MAQLKDLLVTGATRILGKVYSPEFVGKLTGNADTATKATGDSNGQNIVSTYIKNLSIDGKTLNIYKGNGSNSSLTIKDKIYAGNRITTVDDLNKFIEQGTFKYGIINPLEGLNGLEKNDGIVLSFSWDNSTAWGHQIFLDDSSYNMAHRHLNNGTWQAWVKMIDANNYTNYTVTKTGSGASGIWGISITGNSGTATKLQTARTISLTGSVTGSGSFDGSGNLTISTTTNHTHNQYYDSGISRAANTVLAAPNGKAGSASFRALVAADIPSITKSKITDFPSSLPASDVYAWAKASSKPSYSWGEITGKPSTFAPSSHTHNYAGSSSAGGAANSTNAINWVAGNEIRFAKPGYKSPQSLHIGWAWSDGSKIKLINEYIFDGGDGNKTQVTASQFNGSLNGNASSASSVAWTNVSGRPSSLPASDVYAWAKASTKPSYSWGEITGKPSTFTPSAHNHSLLVTTGDNRNSNTTPNSYASNLVFQGLKANTKIDSPSGDTYSYVVGLRGWKDSSGGYAHELAFNDSGIFARRGSTTSWNVGWQKIALNRSSVMFPGISLDDNGAYIYGESNSGNILFRFRPSSSADYSYTNVSYLYNNKLGAQNANGYWGMATPYGGSDDWIRTTSNGIIPYQSGGVGGGHGYLGTSSWYFSQAYIDTINAYNINATGYVQANGLINTFSEYQSQKGSRDWRFGSATGNGDQNWFGFYDYTYGFHGGWYGPTHSFRANGEIISTSTNAFRAVYGNYGFIIRNDGANTYFMMTNSGDPYGTWNDNYTIFTPNGEWQVKKSQYDGGMPTSRGYVVISDSNADRVYSLSNYNASYLKIRGGLGSYHCTYSNSDIRLKMNVKDSEINALNTINRIKVRQFNWKKDGKHQKIGFIADELEEIDKKFSIGGGYEDKEGKIMDVKSVDTFYLMGYIVKAIQELSEQNLTLKQENDKILKEIELLKSRGESN